MNHTLPVPLAPNPIEHFYLGGRRIAELRGLRPTSPRQPEEWVGATVTRFGEALIGLGHVEGGELVRDLVERDPEGWLGSGAAAQRRASSGDIGILVKLLDAGQRLPVHVHPSRAFARSHLGCPYGKTEAWFVLSADDDAAVYLGWSENVSPEQLAERRDAQDSDWMLSRMNRLTVRAGDGILVPAGVPHAIGAGVFLVEVQEPTDLSIVLEWSVTTSGREDSHLGLGFEAAMQGVSHRALPPAELNSLRRHLGSTDVGPGLLRCLPAEADDFFRLEVAAPGRGGSTRVPAGFAVLIALDGAGEITTAGGGRRVRRGETLAVPAACGDWVVEGPVRLAVARPGPRWPSDLRAGAGS